MPSATKDETELFADFVGGEITVECEDPHSVLWGTITSTYSNGSVLHVQFTYDGHKAGTSVLLPHDLDASTASLTLQTPKGRVVTINRR